MRTVSINRETAQREWYVIDLAGATVGRAAAQVASILRGKNKPSFTPHADTGDFVVAINAEKVVFTGSKLKQKKYRHHSLYPGGLKEATAAEVLAKHPERIFQAAVQGMLPKNPLGRSMLGKLKVYSGPEHPHAAQSPKSLSLSA
jgi:large subunit ribosomal protein L13